MLGPGVVREGVFLDLVDVDGRTGRRYRVDLPDSVSAGSLSQLAVGEGYYWLRSRKGTEPTVRIDRYALTEDGAVDFVLQDLDEIESHEAVAERR